MSLIVLNSASNPLHQCRQNEKLVLHILRQQHRESKANLARLAGLTAAAIGGIVTSLEAKGLIENIGKLQGDMGQPATLYALAGQGAYGIGVSINRGYLETIMMNFVGQVLASKKHRIILPAPQTVLTMVLEDISSLTESLSQEVTQRIVGIGVAQPYHIGSWLADNQDWQAWDNFNLADELASRTGLPALTQNDGNAGAIAELIYGNKPEVKDFIYFYFGTPMVRSLGGGVVLDGECRSGVSGNAGDVGLMPMPIEPSFVGTLGDSGKAPLLNHSCALYSLVCYLRHKGAAISTREDYDRALEQYSSDVDAWLDHSVRALVVAIQGVQALLDVCEVVVDCEDADTEIVARMIAGLDAHLAKCSKKEFVMPCARKGSFGSQASAIGAATVPLGACFTPK